MAKKGIFLKEFSQDGEIKAICPMCNEEIFNADIEMFYACPFCGCAFKDNGDLEEFIMIPIIDSWVKSKLPTDNTGV